MNDFTASNGLKMSRLDGDGLRVAIPPDGYEGWQKLNLHASTVVALRELFRAEDDQRLGRWRWPENPDYVVYPPSEDDDEDAGLCILFEPGGGSSNRYTREWLAGVVDPDGWAVARCARAYFDAHPEPKPWYEASIGDVWVMEPLKVVYTVVGGNERWFTRGDVFGNAERRELNDPVFTAGRRI